MRAFSSLVFGILAGGSGILISAATFQSGHPTLWWGLMVIGGWSTLVGVTGLIFVPQVADAGGWRRRPEPTRRANAGRGSLRLPAERGNSAGSGAHVQDEEQG